MTGPQQRLYTGMVRLFATFGVGGVVWRRTRATGAAPGTPPTIAHTSNIAMRFCPNNRVVEQPSLPGAAIFAAPYWGLATIDVDIQAGDIFDAGAVALLITGTPDSSQGFLVAPAKLTEVPS